MRQCNRRASIIAAAATLLSASVLHAALPPTAELPGPSSVTGQLLVATPALQGPPFGHSVILLAQHNRDGALGIVINRPLGQVAIPSLLEAFGADNAGVTGSVLVFFGGPVVDPQIVFVLHSPEYRDTGTMDIDGRVALTSGAAILRDIGLGKGPRKSLVAVGYAGWGPGQLDNELKQGFWAAVPEDPALVFDDDRSKVWADAMARRKMQ